MKYLKVKIALALAGLVVLALIGSTSASASMCKAQEAVCSAANTYPIGTTIEAETAPGKPLRFKSSLYEIDCNSRLIGEVTGSESLKVNISTAYCHLLEGVESFTTSWSNPIVGHQEGTAKMAFTNPSEGGSVSFSYVGGSTYQCTLSTTSMALSFWHGAGGEPIFEAGGLALARNGAKCPNTNLLSGKWIVNSPRPLWLEG